MNGIFFTKMWQQFIFESGFYSDAVLFKFATQKGNFETYSVIQDLEIEEKLKETNLYFIKQDEFNYKAYYDKEDSLEEIPEYDVDIRTMECVNYPSIDYVNSYKFGSSNYKGFIGDYGDQCLIQLNQVLLQSSCDKIIEEYKKNNDNSFNSSNCYVYTF